MVAGVVELDEERLCTAALINQAVFDSHCHRRNLCPAFAYAAQDYKAMDEDETGQSDECRTNCCCCSVSGRERLDEI
jgi:hypothetical protein